MRKEREREVVCVLCLKFFFFLCSRNPRRNYFEPSRFLFLYFLFLFFEFFLNGRIRQTRVV